MELELSEQAQNQAKMEITQALKVEQESIFYMGNRFVIHKNDVRITIKELDFKICQKYPLIFSKCDFQCDVNIWMEISSKLEFISCIFHLSCNFNFKESGLVFLDCVFKAKSNFNVILEEKFYLENCVFEMEANFGGSQFLKHTSFYGTTFKNCPNFARCQFGESLNLIGVNLEFDFKNMQALINEAKLSTEIQDVRYRHTVKDFRDIFRNFKNALTREGNILDASNYHRIELYAKEIELDSKNLPIFSKDWIEKWQLWFYRHTSDHHTDLMRIISWVIIAIGAFGLTFFWVKCIQDPSTISCLNLYAVNLSLWGTIFLLIPYLAGWIKSFFIFAGSVGLIPILWIVCYRPSLIFGAVNLLEKNPKYSGLENIILAIYTLIMILLLFSLQKTARKNSIVPS